MNEPPAMAGLLRAQNGLITRQQALGLLSRGAVAHRLGRTWQVVLPGIYCVTTGQLTDRQTIRAALLWGGDDAQLDDLTALRSYRCRYLPSDQRTFILVPATRQRQSRDFVVVRRTHYLPPPAITHDHMPLAPLSRALTDFALRHDNERDVRAVLAAAVQRKQVTVRELAAEQVTAPSRGASRLTRVLAELWAGVLSAPEGDIRRLIASSRVLPLPVFNCLLRFPCGRVVSPDALIEDAALIHETNGRQPHAEEDDFDSMQERHDFLTTAGFTVLHNSPRMVATGATRILRQLEACYARDAGKGLPRGVVMLRRGPHNNG